MTQLTDSMYAVEVPSMAFGLMVNNYAKESELMYMLSMEDIADDDNTEETLITKKLPPGNWQLLCTTREISEEQAKEFLEWFQVDNSIGWRDYFEKEPFRYKYTNYKHSLNSLIASNNLDPEMNYVLLKKM